MQRTSAIIASALLAITSGAATAAGGNPAAGEAKSQACTACHGERGNSTNAMFPRLNGQHESYLYRALRHYKSGARQNPVMSGQVAGLSDQDMRDLAAYYASQQGLGTVSLRRRNE